MLVDAGVVEPALGAIVVANLEHILALKDRRPKVVVSELVGEHDLGRLVALRLRAGVVDAPAEGAELLEDQIVDLLGSHGRPREDMVRPREHALVERRLEVHRVPRQLLELVRVVRERRHDLTSGGRGRAEWRERRMDRGGRNRWPRVAREKTARGGAPRCAQTRAHTARLRALSAVLCGSASGSRELAAFLSQSPARRGRAARGGEENAAQSPSNSPRRARRLCADCARSAA